MIDAFRRMDRLSRTMRQKARDVQRAQAELEARADDRGGRSGGPHGHLARRSARQLQRPLGDGLARSHAREGRRRFVPRAEKPTHDEDIDFTGFEERELYEDLARAVQGLPDRERLVVALYYVEKLTMKDIATVLGVSETRVSQLHGQAVKRLRRALLRSRLKGMSKISLSVGPFLSWRYGRLPRTSMRGRTRNLAGCVLEITHQPLGR